MNDDFQFIIDSLVDNNKPFPPKFLHRFSDLEKIELNILRANWDSISEGRKLNLLDDFIDLSNAETLVNFDEIGIIALQDDLSQIRARALELMEYSEDYKLIPHITRIINSDPEISVKVAALRASAHFVYKGEVDEYPKVAFRKLTATLKETIQNQNPEEIQQNALEALAYSSETDVKKLIEAANARNDVNWKSSALIAMGRSLDPHWKKTILDSLMDDNPATIISAIKAAGDMEIPSARALIISLLKNHNGDDLIEKNSAWALARIGGPGVKGILDNFLLHAEGEDETAFYEDCLDEFTFRHDPLAQSMFNFKIENEKTVIDDESMDELFDIADDEDFEEGNDRLDS